MYIRTREAAGESVVKCAYCRQHAPQHAAEGFAYLTERAERGDGQALFLLSHLYRHGGQDDVVVPDPKLSLECLLRAAEKRHADARVELGGNMCGLLGLTKLGVACGHDPLPIPIDLEKGTALLTEAAALGSGRARYLLAQRELHVIHEDEKDVAYALGLLLRARELGDPSAEMSLKAAEQDSSMDTADTKHKADHALGKALESNDLDDLRRAIEEHLKVASPGVLQEARRVRKKWKKRARKQRSSVEVT